MQDNTPENVGKNAENQPKSDLEKLAKLEQDLLEKIEKKAEIKKLEDQADAEMAAAADPMSSVSAEQIFLLLGAVILLCSLAFLHYLLAILLTIFAIIICLVAGFSSGDHPLSPRLNLAVSIIGLLLFEYSAIFIHTISGANGGFWIYQLLALLFLFATFASARTYRKRVMER